MFLAADRPSLWLWAPIGQRRAARIPGWTAGIAATPHADQSPDGENRFSTVRSVGDHVADHHFEAEKRYVFLPSLARSRSRSHSPGELHYFNRDTIEKDPLTNQGTGWLELTRSNAGRGDEMTPTTKLTEKTIDAKSKNAKRRGDWLSYSVLIDARYCVKNDEQS